MCQSPPPLSARMSSSFLGIISSSSKRIQLPSACARARGDASSGRAAAHARSATPRWRRRRALLRDSPSRSGLVVPRKEPYQHKIRWPLPRASLSPASAPRFPRPALSHLLDPRRCSAAATLPPLPTLPNSPPPPPAFSHLLDPGRVVPAVGAAPLVRQHAKQLVLACAYDSTAQHTSSARRPFPNAPPPLPRDPPTSPRATKRHLFPPSPQTKLKLNPRLRHTCGLPHTVHVLLASRARTTKKPPLPRSPSTDPARDAAAPVGCPTKPPPPPARPLGPAAAAPSTSIAAAAADDDDGAAASVSIGAAAAAPSAGAGAAPLLLLPPAGAPLGFCFLVFCACRGSRQGGSQVPVRRALALAQALRSPARLRPRRSDKLQVLLMGLLVPHLGLHLAVHHHLPRTTSPPRPSAPTPTPTAAPWPPPRSPPPP